MAFRGGISKCPESSVEQEKLAKSLGCAEANQYHCLKDQLGKLGELCVRPSWIPAGYCPEYNTEASRVDAEKCDKSFGLCPAKTYLSNEVLSYSACLRSKPVDSADKPSQTASNETSTFTSSTTESVPSQLQFSSTRSPTIIIGITAGIAVLFIISIIFVVCLVNRRRQNNKRRGTADSRESMTQLVHLQNKFQEMTRIFNCEHFYETRAYKNLHSLIEAGQSAILVGHPGTGKSATCVKLYESFYMRKGFNCFILDHDFDLLDLDHQNYDLIFLDDYFESGFYRKGFDDHCRKLVSKINTLFSKSETLRMVITIDSAMLSLHEEIFKKLTFFSNMINLTASEDAVQSDEKRGILEKQLQRRSITIVDLPENEIWTTSSKGADQLAISKKTINEIVKDSDSTTNYGCGFPLACYLFCRRKTLFKWRSKFFDEPLLKVKHHIEKLRQSDDPAYTLQYLVYIYTVLRGEIKPHHLDYKLLESVIKDVVPLFSQSTGHVGDMAEIQTEKWKDTCNTSDYLVEYDNGRYKFIHECILLVVLCDFGTWRNDLLQKLCDNKNTLLKFERAKYFAANAENSIIGKTSKDASSLAKNLRSFTDREPPLPLKRRGKDRYLFEEEESIQPLID